MRKYFFFDIDGTLTTPLTADYPDSTREAIRQLQEHGHFLWLRGGYRPMRQRWQGSWRFLRSFLTAEMQ